MRIATIWVAAPNAYYRAVYPLQAMARRGHRIVFPPDPEGGPDVSWLTGCDLVHVYRRMDRDTWTILAELAAGGTAITYDNDDDYTTIPEESPAFEENGGARGELLFAATVTAARRARAFTTTNAALAERYRQAGVERIAVIGNHLAPGAVRPRRQHEGLVVGWIAGSEHQADAVRLRIDEAVGRLMAKHPEIRVECIGIDLRFPERYRHDIHVLFENVPDRLAGWDIGLAPLADIPYNRFRSDIKVKEYAASGVPWLASPVGPYEGLGEEQGGRLVPDDGWFEALDRLVTNQREREHLARNAAGWAGTQTIEAVADRWEEVFVRAAGRAGAHVWAKSTP